MPTAPAPAPLHLSAGEPAASTSRLQLSSPDVPPPATPAFLHHPTPASIAAILNEEEAESLRSGQSNDVRTSTILRNALRWAVRHADVELVGWLAALDGRLGAILDGEVATMDDEEGWGVVGMAIQSSCGRSGAEEAVRLLVGRWGVSAGPRDGRDKAGWTPLHLAAILSSPQTVSVLLNRGASINAVTDSGLSAFDLITDMEGRESLSMLLDPMNHSAPPTPAPGSFALQQVQPANNLDPDRRRRLERRRARVATRGSREEARTNKIRIEAERERWVRERAKEIGVDATVLFPPLEEQKPRGQRGALDDDDDDDNDHDDELDRIEDDLYDLYENEDMSETSVYEECLSFSINHLPAIFEIFITDYTPVCKPRAKRSLPANAIFLYARFAHYRCDETWLEDLLEGAVERIENGVYGNGEDLAHMAFWEYNLTLLLYLIRSDKSLFATCEELSLISMMEELINAIHVFIIRIAERRIDEILDAAMLDFESIEDLFPDVRFEDQWNLFRSFGKKKPRDTPLAAAMFSSPNSTPGREVESPHKRSLSRQSGKSLGRPSSIHDLKGAAAAAKAEAKEVFATGIEKAQAVFGDKPSPRRVADILTNVLLILQLYEVNPAFIVQVFSQVFFWIASELFNRVITRKKYLCRTKAVQIRMNVTALEDWTRSNGLPPNIASKHFQPIMQLIEWLQCSSSIRQFDALIETLQRFHSLNPLQMRRAVRDYRYEVDEERMADDCNQYLAQLQRDWERRRVRIAAERGQPDGTQDWMPIEALFDGSVALVQWVPQTAPESLGELLDSRFMLPFLVPSDTEYLRATPPPDAAFRNLMMDAPLLPDGSIKSRPLSSASNSSSKPLGWVTPGDRVVRELPEGFFAWLKKRQSEVISDPLRRPENERQGSHERKTSTDSVVSTRPLLEAIKTAGEKVLPALVEDKEVTPLATDRKPLPPLQGSPDPKRISAELAHKGSPTDQPGESIELWPRNPNGGTNGHYELARHRRERQASISSIGSATGTSPENKKRWWSSIGRKSSVGSVNGPEEVALATRRRREGTEDTLVPERGDRDNTPLAESPMRG